MIAFEKRSIWPWDTSCGGRGIPDAGRRLRDKNKGANDISHGERRRAFWRRIGVELKSDKKEALDNRRPMSHRGFILRKSEDRVMQKLLDRTSVRVRSSIGAFGLARIRWAGTRLQ